MPDTYYVAPTGGSDSNSGTTIGAPWATLSKAAQSATAGATVYLRDGEWADQTIASQARSGEPITYKPYPDEQPILRTDTLGYALTVEGTSSRLDFKGIKFTGRARVRGPASHVRFIATEHESQGIATFQVSGNYPRHVGAYGAWIHDLVQQVPLTGSPAGTQGAYAFEMTGHHLRVVGCHLDDVDGDGIAIGGSNIWIVGNRVNDVVPGWDPAEHCDFVQILTNSSRVRILNNLVRNVGQGVFIKGLVGNPATNIYTDIVIAGNVIDGAGSNAINLYDCPGVVVVHNTVLNAANFGLRLNTIEGGEPDRMTGAIVRNNILDQFDAGNMATMVAQDKSNLILNPTNGVTYDASDILSQTPAFENAAAGDYRLTAASVGVGDAIQYGSRLWHRDYRGTARTNSPDIGACQR